MTNQTVQLFDEPIVDLIRRRTSVRTYSSRPLPDDVLEKLAQRAHSIQGPFQTPLRLELLDKVSVATEAGVRLGTYGTIRGATHFVAAVADRMPRGEEQVGYVLEHLVLYATSLGLGTCWIGGFFNRSAFAKAVALHRGEFLPIVTPVGYSSTFRAPLDALFHGFARSTSRKLWAQLFFTRDLAPLTEADAGPYALPLEMLRLAPSASNRQPWRVIRDGSRFHLYLEHNALYRRALGYDMQKIDMGIAMFHFEATADEAGLPGDWSSEPPALNGLPAQFEHMITWVPQTSQQSK